MAGVQCLSYEEDESVEALLVAQNVDTVRAGGRWCCLGWFYAFRLAESQVEYVGCAMQAPLLDDGRPRRGDNGEMASFSSGCPWLALESNPAVFTEFSQRIGLPARWQFCDVLGLDKELLGLVPRPVAACVLLFPCSERIYAARREQDAALRAGGSLRGASPCHEDGVFFLRQVIGFGNACGTVACLHATSNSRDWMQTRCPDRHGPPLDHHFAAFTRSRQNRIIELDGTKRGPVDHGPTSEASFLEDVAAAVKRNFMDVEPDLACFKGSTNKGLLFFFITFVGSSVAALEPNQFGLTKNVVSGSIAPYVLRGGLHILGPLRSFIVFPAAQGTLEFSMVSPDRQPVKTRTGADPQDPDSGGQPISISCAVQVQFVEETLQQVYLSFGSFEAARQRQLLLAGNVVSNTAQEYTPTDFWTKRDDIAARMLEKINGTLWRQAYVKAMQFEIMKVDFAKQFEDSITAVQVAEQAKVVNEYEQQVQRVVQHISVMKSENEAAIANISAGAEAKSKEIRAAARRDAFNLKQGMKAQKYSELQKKLELNGARAAAARLWSACPRLASDRLRLARSIPTSSSREARSSGEVSPRDPVKVVAALVQGSGFSGL
eukprot:s1680_g3.t2